MNFDELCITLDPNAIAPIHAHAEDAGYDLCTPFMVVVPANGRTVVDTGIHMDIPVGYYGRIESKSGIMRNKGITARGTIDSGYRGTIQVVLINHSNTPVTFERGDKITQIVFLKCYTPLIKIVDSFDGETARGSDGFGSTGK